MEARNLQQVVMILHIGVFEKVLFKNIRDQNF